MDKEISNRQNIHNHIRNELHAEEIQPDKGTPQMTAERNSVGHEDQSPFVTGHIPDTQDGKFLDNYNDSEVAVRALPGDPSELNDVSSLDRSKLKVIVVM